MKGERIANTKKMMLINSSVVMLGVIGATGVVSGADAFMMGVVEMPTNSSRDTSKSFAILISFSSSGTAISFSHLETDWRDTSIALAKSSWDSFFSIRNL